MAEPKTRPTRVKVSDFLRTVKDEQKRKDCQTLVRLMKRVTGARAVMWGPSIVGFGTFPLRYANGKVLDWPLTGFSPRKQSLSIYVMTGSTKYSALMKKLGEHSTGVSCLYVKRLSDVDMNVLTDIIRLSVSSLKKRSR